MSNNPMSTDELDEILTTVHEELEDGASADRVKQIADSNPQFHKEIFAFAAEWFASDGSDLSDDTLGIDRTVAGHTVLLERFWQLARPEAVDPFEGMPTEELQSVADKCRLDMAILRQLVRGHIDEATIPGKLVVWLANATGTRTAEVWSRLSAPATASADYFAPSGKRTGKKATFAEAIRNSDLSPADKQFWLAHLDA